MYIISKYSIPVVIILVLIGYVAKTGKSDGIFTDFAEGAATGLTALARVLPSLVGLLAAIAVFRASGLLELLTNLLKPLTAAIGMPEEILPIALMRPLSGSGSLAILTDIYRIYGPDSMTGKIASVIMGSTETTFYTISVYFGAVGVKNTKYTLAAALLADTASVAAAIAVCRWLFILG